jgi:hypothetical protein
MLHALTSAEDALEDLFDLLRDAVADADAIHGRADHLAAATSCLSASMREAAHLFGYDGKALACFTGARGFDGRIEREKVGLERDLVDHLNDARDLLARALDLPHDLGHAADVLLTRTLRRCSLLG